MSRIPGQFQGEEDVDQDTLSAPAPIERRAVHPYRDRREALIERRRALAHELHDAERAVEKRERIKQRLNVIDEELRHHGSALLDNIAIETPCRAKWEEMRGDDQVRHCKRCDRAVYDLSHMTQLEIEALFARSATMPCVRFRRRRDGRVVTADCPVEPPSVTRRALRTVAAGVLFGASAAGAAALLSAPTMGGVRATPASVALPIERVPVPVVPIEPPPPVQRRFTMGRPRAPEPITQDDLDRHIRWIAPQAWEIDRGLADRAISSASSLRSPPVIPHEVDGRVVGVKIYGIRRDSMLGRLGLQNGDTLLDVNGTPMASPDDMLAAFPRLRSSDAIFLSLERRGEERVHVYRITPTPLVDPWEALPR